MKLKYLENENAFFIIFKGLSMKQITQLFVEVESPTLNTLLMMLGPMPNVNLIFNLYVSGFFTVYFELVFVVNDVSII